MMKYQSVAYPKYTWSDWIFSYIFQTWFQAVNVKYVLNIIYTELKIYKINMDNTPTTETYFQHIKFIKLNVRGLGVASKWQKIIQEISKFKYDVLL